jgi:hypothetical protein
MFWPSNGRRDQTSFFGFSIGGITTTTTIIHEPIIYIASRRVVEKLVVAFATTHTLEDPLEVELSAERMRYEAWAHMLSLREPWREVAPTYRDPNPRNVLLETGRARVARRRRRRWRRSRAAARRTW